MSDYFNMAVGAGLVLVGLAGIAVSPLDSFQLISDFNSVSEGFARGAMLLSSMAVTTWGMMKLS